MINLANACGVPSVLFEMLAQVDLAGVLVATEHERLSRRAARCALAVGSVEDKTAACQRVDVRCLSESIAVAAQHTCLQIIRDDEQDILDGRLGWLLSKSVNRLPNADNHQEQYVEGS